jgi:hypothetical protein
MTSTCVQLGNDPTDYFLALLDSEKKLQLRESPTHYSSIVATSLLNYSENCKIILFCDVCNT